MQRDRAALERAGNSAGAQKAAGRMGQLAEGLQRDPQLEAALAKRAPELALKPERERSIGQELSRSVEPTRDHDRGMSR
ncbi:MAG: hypothetical protein EOO77_17950 [Oxalobacteraceae bacterium]|nr:MAG: hypothetical protein EOO77_17950 [Oxalobacteraceae bacterium]